MRWAISRRDFLKLTGGVVGGIVTYTAIDAYYELTAYGRFVRSFFTPKNQQPPTQLSSLYGRLFFDYNGNGIQEGEEPAVSGAKVMLKDNTDKVIAEAVTDSAGDYKLEDVPTSSYKLYVEANKKFRHMCTSPEEFRAMSESYNILLQEDSKIDIGLMEGVLTLPVSKKSDILEEPYYVDLDPRENHLRDWKGNTRTSDQHLGTDYGLRVGTDVVATAPGNVIEAVSGWPDVPSDPNLGLLDDGNRVTINHGLVNPYGYNFYSIYCHLDKIICYEGQKVKRGEKIAESGNTGYASKGPHLHFQIGGFGNKRVDPYRDLINPDSLTYWTKDNDPQYFEQG